MSVAGETQEHKIISEFQSGFGKFHSCTTTLHNMYSSWLDKKDWKHTLALIFLDFQKAFNVVNHQILVKKLEHIGISGNFFNMLQSFLHSRHQCVKINNQLSSFLPVTSGVPQGSILAPILFQIFINDLLDLPLHCSVHAYTDDTSFFISNREPSRLQAQLNHDPTLIQKWCEDNLMSLNIKSHTTF